MSHKRKREDKRRLKKLYEETHKHSYKYGGAWYNPKKKRITLVSSTRTPGLAKAIRKMCNKRVRRQDEVPDGNAYRKLAEYQNTLW